MTAPRENGMEQGLDDWIAALDRLAGARLGAPEDLHRVLAALHGLCAAIADEERRGADPAALRLRLASTRAHFATSPFVRRLQTWPRGYPGDFETIERLLGGAPEPAPGTFAYWVELASLQAPIAQQHRNKVRKQAALLERCARERGAEARILVLAAGSGADVVEASEALARAEVRLVLNDNDPDALALCRARLAGLGDRVVYVQGNALRSVPALAAHGPYDLVLAGGLFDYVPEPFAVRFVRAICGRLLAPGGVFFFTNILRGNPYRVLIENIGDWRLLERSPEEILALVARATDGRCDARWEPDATGLTALVSVTRPR